MKKFLSIFCALITAISFTACSSSVKPESGSDNGNSSSSDTVSSGSGQSDTSSNTPDNPYTVYPFDESHPLPKMDGSTSAIPLEIGLRSGILGISYAQAKKMVSHTTTHDSFKRLISGEVDLIFSVPISAEQQKAADDAGVKLIMEPVAREGFVFVVNADNPVDSLTSDQIRKIYSGEITNWSQVGGKDQAILPYQRNTDSGSQNYMTVFMGDTPLLEPKKEFVAGGMAGIMDAVAVYDNSAGAIGYSVYSYAAQMYANTSNVKFIAVDGVAPSKQTMADESYPLLSCTYLIYTDKSPESAKHFVESALSDEGQTYVLESGYLPVNGMEVPAKYFPYEAVGTGAPKPADYKPSQNYSEMYIGVYIDGNTAILQTEDTFKLMFLKNKELQDKINADILEAVTKMKSTKPLEADQWIDGKNQKDAWLRAYCRNGYLSLVIFTYVTLPDIYNGYDQIETLTYDLFTGEKIEHFSDLFYEGTDFLPLINKQLAAHINAFEFVYSDDGNEPKLDFSCILGEPRLFTINEIGFENGGTYFPYGTFVEYTGTGWSAFQESDYLSVVSQYRDMTSLVEDSFVDSVYEHSFDNEYKTKHVIEDGDVYVRFTDSDFHTPEEVEEQDKFWHELQRRTWERFRKTDPDYISRGAVIREIHDGYYRVGHFYAAAGDMDFVNFDADTLEIITIDMLVGKDWRQYIKDDYDDRYKVFEKCSTLYPTYWYSLPDEDKVTVYAFADKPLENTWPVTTLEVPAENINKKYFTADDIL